ncbi:MAG TPA: HAD family hydrolase [Vicinamibacterales bacterium]|jgi:phosphoglycolate phosphatase-like HAD superfamily hydrolase
MVKAAVIVLFDVDGTLIKSGGAGLRGMNAAFERLYGVPNALDGVTLAGRTDLAIVGDVFRGMGLEPTPEEVARVRAAYVEDLRVEMKRPVAEPAGVLPGVETLLDAVETLPHVRVGLLTGNFEPGAVVKLEHFDLWRRFAFGAFGDDHVDRRALVPVALARAMPAGHATPPSSRIVIVGDTPLDVDCAKAHGARAVAVATGPFDRAALSAAGADLVVDTFSDAAHVARWLEEI